MKTCYTSYMLLMLFSTFIMGCSTEDYIYSENMVYTDSINYSDTIFIEDTTFSNDTIIIIDSIMNNTDTLLLRDTIIQRDTTVESKSFIYTAEIYATIPNLGTCQGQSFQGMSTYNSYAFCFYNTGICRCVDLESKKIISEFYLPDEAHHNKNHAGVACFSNDFISENDKFPLLYLSSYQERKCYVLRMSTNNAELIQTILTVDSTNKNKIQDVWAYEPDGDLLLLKMSYQNENNKYGYNWVSIKRPSALESTNIYLDINNKIDNFITQSTAKYNAGFVLNGKIYQLAGYEPSKRKLYILDYIKKKIVADIMWNNPIINDKEQEQCSRYKEGILINYNHSDKLVYIKFNNWSF